MTNHEMIFPALQGSNLLGFLAALGVIRTLDAQPDTRGLRMRWVERGGSYCPIVELAREIERETIVDSLRAALGRLADHYVLTVDKDLKIQGGNFRKLAAQAAEDFLANSDPAAAGMVAAFGCDAVRNDDGTIRDTAFRTMSGAGHQHFLEFMTVLARETTAAQLTEALFGPWRYRDASPTMRWDAEDDRRYALRWDEPSKDPARTVRGANLLAVAALPLFPVVPTSGSAVATTGFTGRGGRDTFVTWPIWSGWLGLDAICSLLALEQGRDEDVVIANEGLARGILARYRSQRINPTSKYRNFTPAQPVG